MTVIRRAIDVALALLVVAVVAIGLAANLAPQAGSRLFAIRTGSMEPMMPVGSLVVATAVDPDRIVVGDVVTIQLDGGSTMTHRVSAIVERDDGWMFELKGDANAVHDPVLVGGETVVGRVDLAVPLLGYLLAMLSMPTGIAALLSIGGTLLTAGWLLDELTDAEADEDLAAERVEQERLDATNVVGLDLAAWSEERLEGPSELAYEGSAPR